MLLLLPDVVDDMLLPSVEPDAPGVIDPMLPFDIPGDIVPFPPLGDDIVPVLPDCAPIPPPVDWEPIAPDAPAEPELPAAPDAPAPPPAEPPVD